MPNAKGGNVAQSPQTRRVPPGTPGPQGEWNGQCPINKQYSLKPPGPRASRSRGLTCSFLDSHKELAQGADCHREQKAHTLALPLCPPGEPAAPAPCTGPLAGWNKKEKGLVQLSPILSGAAPWGRSRVGVGARAPGAGGSWPVLSRSVLLYLPRAPRGSSST